MMTRKVVLLMTVGALAAGCGSQTQPTSTSTLATVWIVYRGATERRTDLPASAESCVQGVGLTHIHPSWRAFAGIPLQAVPQLGYDLTFDDVPAGTRVSFRVNDRNWCDRNPTGAVLNGVFVNDVPLVQNALTPGSGQEPGYAFTVDSTGRITQ
jgi:hypothetical protein